MTTPNVTRFTPLSPLLIQSYERYLPTAFDENLTLLQKMNKIIKYLHDQGTLLKDVFDQWNEFAEWVLNEGLEDAVADKIEELLANGRLGDELFRALNEVKKKFYRNVLDLGVKGDGTNEQVIIQDILNKYDRLYFPSDIPHGKYIVKSLQGKSTHDIVGDFNQTIIKGDCEDNKPVIRFEGTAEQNIYNARVSDMVFEGTTQPVLVSIKYASNVVFHRCFIYGDERRLCDGFVIDNASYYYEIRDCRVSNTNNGAIIKGKSNSGSVVNTLFYNVENGVEILEANGTKILENTFQDYRISGVQLSDLGQGYTSQNHVENNYFEKSYREPANVIAGIVFNESANGATVGVTTLGANKYSDLPTVSGNSKYPIILEWSGATFGDSMRIPNFLQVAPKPKNYDVYTGSKLHGSVQLFSDQDGTDEFKGLVKNIVNGFTQWEWIKFLTVQKDGQLKWSDYSIVGLKSLNLYFNAVLQLPTGDNATERNFVYDTSFKTTKAYDGSKWWYTQVNGYGQTLPSVWPEGNSYVLTTTKKRYTRISGAWYDSNGVAVNSSGGAL